MRMTEKWTCFVCGAELSEKYHVNGRDYCREHKPAPRPSVWDESVRGFVIGGDDLTDYQFWQGDRKIAATRARNDGSAIEWFRVNYPDEFAKGAEMRAFDI